MRWTCKNCPNLRICKATKLEYCSGKKFDPKDCTKEDPLKQQPKPYGRKKI